MAEPGAEVNAVAALLEQSPDPGRMAIAMITIGADALLRIGDKAAAAGALIEVLRKVHGSADSPPLTFAHEPGHG